MRQAGPFGFYGHTPGLRRRFDGLCCRRFAFVAGFLGRDEFAVRSTLPLGRGFLGQLGSGINGVSRRLLLDSILFRLSFVVFLHRRFDLSVEIVVYLRWHQTIFSAFLRAMLLRLVRHTALGDRVHNPSHSQHHGRGARVIHTRVHYLEGVYRWLHSSCSASNPRAAQPALQSTHCRTARNIQEDRTRLSAQPGCGYEAAASPPSPWTVDPKSSAASLVPSPTPTLLRPPRRPLPGRRLMNELLGHRGRDA